MLIVLLVLEEMLSLWLLYILFLVPVSINLLSLLSPPPLETSEYYLVYRNFIAVSKLSYNKHWRQKLSCFQESKSFIDLPHIQTFYINSYYKFFKFCLFYSERMMSKLNNKSTFLYVQTSSI